MGEERIEIELSVDDPAGSPFAPGGRADVLTARGPGGPPDGYERRLVFAALGAGIVGLAFGWMLGRSTAPVESFVAAVTAPTTIAERNPIEPIEAPPPETTTPPNASVVAPSTASPPSTVDPARVSEPETSPAALDDRLVGQPIEIVSVGFGRNVAWLDLTAQTITTRDLELPPFGRPDLFVGDDWALMPSSDPGFPGTLLQGDAGPADLVFDGSFELLGADGDGLWVADRGDGDPVGITVRLLDLSGGDTGVELVLPSVPDAIDPGGGLLVKAGGAWFTVSALESTRITDGELLAAGSTTAVARECDAAFECRVVAIDRGSGERSDVAVRTDSETALVERSPGRFSSVTDDGSAAIVSVVRPSESTTPSLAVLDLTTGELANVGATRDDSLVTFTPDGRFLLFLGGGRLLAYDRLDGAVFDVSSALSTPETFGVRVIGG